MLEMIAIMANIFFMLMPAWVLWYLIDYFKYDQDGWEIDKWWTKIQF